MDVRKKLFSIAILCWVFVLLYTLPSQGGVMLTAHHRLISSQETEGEFLTTVEITIRNTGSNLLTAVDLQPMDRAFLSEPGQNTLSLDVLYAGEEIMVEWSAVTFVPPEIIFDGQPILFLGNATDPYGDSVPVTLYSEPLVVQ
ncbi:MAG: hypothetical protein ACE5GU_04205 [Candidatus Scalinduaceae bacterium]